MKRRRLGVIGTLVWDTIYGRDPMSGPVEEWGGIAYSLAGLDAALPDDWEIVPSRREACTVFTISVRAADLPGAPPAVSRAPAETGSDPPALAVAEDS